MGKTDCSVRSEQGRFSAQDALLYAVWSSELDLAQKIVQLLDDAEARTKMGAFGRKRIEAVLEWKYEVPKLLNSYEAVYRRG